VSPVISPLSNRSQLEMNRHEKRMTNRIGQIGNFHQELFKNHYQESMVPFMSVAQKNKYLNAVNSKSPKVDYHSS